MMKPSPPPSTAVWAWKSISNPRRPPNQPLLRRQNVPPRRLMNMSSQTIQTSHLS
ncbi:hypothetical protein EMPG_17370 [Blastomyces silverae]|uniref:Uncharacterized protein n=1 Tax=Blastomyces silverae TaxID=2060906 RepID=A0A0H1B6S3_9EURO|nr:hypothetical protein EMPG_17370 [Blastomyces silverae]